MKISELKKSGFVEVEEKESPLIFNIFNPRYFRKGEQYVVVNSEGLYICWDKTTMSDLLEAENVIAVTNPGKDWLEEE